MTSVRWGVPCTKHTRDDQMFSNLESRSILTMTQAMSCIIRCSSCPCFWVWNIYRLFTTQLMLWGVDLAWRQSPFWGLKTKKNDVFLSVILWTCVVLQSCSLSALQARLKVAAHQAEEESEETAESFLEGKTDIDDFLANFMEKRTVNWTNCQNVKSTSWQKVMGDWYQHTAEFYLRCTFWHFNTSLLSKRW